MRPQDRTVEREVARIAGEQHGVITSGQLRRGRLERGGDRAAGAQGARCCRSSAGSTGSAIALRASRPVTSLLSLPAETARSLSGRAAAHLYGLTEGTDRRLSPDREA